MAAPLAAFTAIALNCHADLAADRPDAGNLTEFYFWLSFGGMLGGLFNALAAPLLFTSVAEYPVAVLLGCLLIRPLEVGPVPASSALNDSPLSTQAAKVAVVITRRL